MVTGQQYVVIFILGRGAESAADAPLSGTVARLYTGTERAAYGGLSSASPDDAAAAAATTTTTGGVGCRRHDRLTEVVTLSTNLELFLFKNEVVLVIPATPRDPLPRAAATTTRDWDRACTAADDEASDDMFPFVFSPGNNSRLRCVRRGVVPPRFFFHEYFFVKIKTLLGFGSNRHKLLWDYYHTLP